MKYCLNCQLEHPDSSKFCKSCGKGLVAKDAVITHGHSCPSCGASVQPGWTFCKQCAFALKPIAAVVSSQATVPVGAGTATGAAGQTEYPTPAMALPHTSAAAAAPQIEQSQCPTCGHWNPGDAQLCEACGALVGAGLKRRRRKRVIVGTFVGLLALIVTAAGLGTAWYLWGVTVTVTTDPANARVFIDGQEIGVRKDVGGTLSLSHVRAGDHTLRVDKDGYDEWKQAFSIAFTDLNKSLNVKLNITKFKLTVVSSPSGSEVLVDNISMGKTSDESGNLETSPLAPGEHTVIVRHDGYRDWKQTVSLKEDTKVDVTLSSAPVYDPGSSSADSEIRNTLEGWAQSTGNRDIDSHMRYYADTLDYYYARTLVPSSKVREDRSKAFAKFNYLSVQLSNMNVQLDSTGQRATVVFDKMFDFRGENNSFYNGSVQEQLTLTKLGGAWLITGEKDLKVYYVNK